MKINERWLRTWVDPNLPIKQIAHYLTMAGIEVEDTIPLGSELEKIVIAEVTEVTKHPNADRLNYCKVHSGEQAHFEIVCGASNVRAGLKVVLAKIGAKLPNGLEIKQAKIRGLESQGMLCSAAELGLAESSQGIIELPIDAPIGEDFAKYWQLPDNRLEIKLTPNRGDCLSIRGIARELSVITHNPLQELKINKSPVQSNQKINVQLLAEHDCPHYVGRVISEINPLAQSPFWLQERLQRCGLRLIHPVVDVCNYVMLELGQPLHGFDLEKLTGKTVQIRKAKHDEKILLLDGQTIHLKEQDLVIADEQQPQALAGIMGGLESAVSSTTTSIFLESAWFNPIIIANSAKRYKIHSDSSHRFERTVDPNLQIAAIERATELLLAIVGGKAGPIIEKIADEYLPQNPIILLRRNRIVKVLGAAINDSLIEGILQKLGMQITSITEGWKVKAPSFRADIRIEADLIEEIARVYGYENIPAVNHSAELKMKVLSEMNLEFSRIRRLLVDRGYHETISYSFIDPKLAQLFDNTPSPRVVNPLSSELSLMRGSLWPGLVAAAAYNLNRQQSRIRLFEIGSIFSYEQGQLQQPMMLSGLASGHIYPEQWGVAKRDIDFFDIKNDVEALFSLTFKNNFEFVIDQHPALHPGRSAAIYSGHHRIGLAGELHPEIQRKLDLSQPIYLFELDLKAVAAINLPQFKIPSKFPAVRRDIAIVLDQDIPIQQIISKIKSISSDLLFNVQLFDIYQGQGIDPEKKSVALSLTFQVDSRTLTDEEINTAMQLIISVLQQEFNATLRI